MKPPRKHSGRDRTPVPDIRMHSPLNSLLLHAPVNHLALDSSGNILDANLAVARLFGKEPRQLRGLPLHQFISERDQEKFCRHLDQCRCPEGRATAELQLNIDGAPTVEFMSSAFRPPRSRKLIVQTVILGRGENSNDLAAAGKGEEAHRLGRTLRALNKSSQAMMRAVDEAEYMNEVCKIVHEDCDHAMVWIGLARNDEAKTIEPVAYAGFEEGDLETLGLTWANPEHGQEPTGAAVRTGQPCMCRISQADPLFGSWRKGAIRRGYAASIALPLVSGEKVFGAITISSRHPDPFSEDEVKLLSELAGALAYGLTAIRLRTAHEAAEQSLRKSEQRYRALFENMTEGFALHEILTDSHGSPRDYRFLDVNPSFERLTGLKRANLVGKRVLEVLPENEPVWIERYGKVALTGEPAHFENFSTPLNRWYEVFAYRPAPLQFAVIFTDITQRKQLEQAQREVEASVRRKLESVLMPEGDLEGLELADLIDVPAMQSLMDDFYAVARFPMSIIDMNGKILVGVGWQDICTGFHRLHPETCKLCIESDTQLSAGVAQGEFRLYKCKNNLWDIATPIVIGSRQVGHVFSGQFFFDDEEVDRERFRAQAGQYGFDEEEYLSALDRVPRLSRFTVDRGMAFLLKLADMLSQLSFSNTKLARLVAERDRLTASLREERERLKHSEEIAHLGSWELDLETGRLVWSDEVYRIFGLQPRAFAPSYDAFLDHVHPDDRAAVDAAYKDSLRNNKDMYEIEHRVLRKATGDVRFVLERCHHVRDESGRIVRSLGMVLDITERKLIEKQVRRSSDRFALLSETAGALLVSSSPQTVVEDLCRKVMAHLDSDIFFNFLVDEGSRRLHLNASGGIEAGEKEKVEWMEFGTAVCGCVARDGRRIIAEDIRHTVDERTELIKSFGVQAYCCHPLVSGDRIIGTLSFGSRRRTRFVGDEIELMRVVADQVSVALQRIRAEEALRESEERLQEALRASRSFAFDWVPATDRMHRSLSCAALLGLTETEAEDDTGQRYFQRIDQADRGRLIATVNSLSPAADRYETKYRFNRPDGGATVLEESGRGFFDSDGKLFRVIGVTTDVTARERAEEALRELNAQLEQRVQDRTAALKETTEALKAERQRFVDVLDVIPAYVILLSPDYRVPFANRYFEERFGKSNGRRCYEYLFNRTEPCEGCETYKALTNNAPLKWEWTGPDERIYDISDFPFTDTDGSRLILEMGVDITERKRAEAELERHRHHLEELVNERTRQLSVANRQLHNEIAERREAEQALQESEERFRLAIQHSKLMAWQCDTEMRFTWVYNSHFGIPGDGLLGKTPGELGIEAGMKEFLAHGGEVLARGMGTRKTIKHVYADNRERYFDQQVEALRDPDGKIVGLIGISLDVTEGTLAEQRLHRSEQSFRLMIGHSGEPMLLVDESGTIECISRRGADQLGYREADLVGSNVERLLDWGGKLDLTMRLEDFSRHAPLPARAVLRIKRNDGSWCWLDVHASFVNYGQRPEKYLLKFELIDTVMTR